MAAGEPEVSERTAIAQRTGKRGTPPVPALAAAVFLAIGVIVLIWASRTPESPATLPPSQEDLAYLSQLDLTDLHLSAEANFLGQDVVYVDGTITNRGGKIITRLRVRAHFYDTGNQLVLREEHDIIRPGEPLLQPGETRSFQLRFDNLPPAWNVRLPQFQLVALEPQQ
jgi:hypothetical protein